MKAKRRWIKYVAAVPTTACALAITSAAIFDMAPANKANKAVKLNSNGVANESTYKYEPLVISSGYNANVIATNSGSEDKLGQWKHVQGVDDNHLRTNAQEISAMPTSYNNACLYTKNVNSSGALPNPDSDGYINITSQYNPEGSTESLRWKIPASKTVETNNCMKLFVGDSTAGDNKSGTFKFKDFGVYNKLYVLCTLSGSGVKSAKIKIKLNYTTGEPTTATYTLYDWFPGDTNWNTMIANNLVATSAYSRYWFNYNDGQHWNHGSGSKETVFNQCAVTVDTTRIPTTLDIELDSTNKGDTLCCYGVTGQIAGDVLAPVSIKTHKTKDTDGNYHNYVTWADGEGEEPSYYYLDIWYYDADGKAVWSKYNSFEIDATSAEGIAKKIEVSDLVTNQKYYVQMRAGNSARVQSANSNIDYIYTDVGCPIRIDCTIPDSGLVNKKEFDIKVNEPLSVKTVVVNDQSPETPCLDQSVVWDIPASHANAITITDSTPQGVTGYKTWTLLSTKPFKMSDTQKLTAKAHADLDKNDAIKGNTKPNSVTPVVSAKANKQATLQWTNPDIGTSSASSNTFTLQVALANDTSYTNPVLNTSVSYDTSGTTSKIATGLTPKTKYIARAKTDYSTPTTNEVLSSDWSSNVEFETTYNAAYSLSLTGGPTVNLMLGNTDTTATVTTTVKDSSNKNATFQNVTWSGDTDYATVTSAAFVQDTATVHTFKPVKATSAKTWTVSVDEMSTITASVNVAVGVSPVTGRAATKIKPDGFTANWFEAKRADNTYWADKYEVILYSSSGTVKARQVITDPTITSFKFDNLDHNTQYKYTIRTVNNGVYSVESDPITVTTEASYPTKLEVYNGTTKLDDMDTLDVLVGSKTSLTTSVIGETFDGTYYAADDQKVNSGDTGGYVTVIDSSDKTKHTVTAVSEGTDAFDLTTNALTRGIPGATLTQTVLVKVEPMQISQITNIGSSSFTVHWPDLSVYAADASKLTYTIEASTTNTFSSPTTIVKTATSDKTSLTFDSLAGSTTYYIRAKYTYSGEDSAYTSTQQVVTQSSITELTLNKSALTIIGNEIDTTLVATINSTAVIQPDWELSDDSICEVEKIDYVSENGITNTRFQITGLNVGETTLTVWPKGNKSYARTCVITIIKGTLDPVRAWADNIKTHSFDLKWSSLKDWRGNAVSYKVNVWYMNGKKRKYVLHDYITTKRRVALGKNRVIPTNTKYYCTVEAFNTNYETREYNIVEVDLKQEKPFPWWIVAASTGGAVGGWLVISYILYIFWKNSILITYDQKKVKDKVKGKKVKTKDKYFRIIDKACVTTNIKMAKRSNSLMTRFGTKNEQKEKYGK